LDIAKSFFYKTIFSSNIDIEYSYLTRNERYESASELLCLALAISQELVQQVWLAKEFSKMRHGILYKSSVWLLN